MTLLLLLLLPLLVGLLLPLLPPGRPGLVRGLAAGAALAQLLVGLLAWRQPPPALTLGWVPPVGLGLVLGGQGVEVCVDHRLQLRERVAAEHTQTHALGDVVGREELLGRGWE